MLYPGERTLNAIDRELRLDAVLTEVRALGRKAVYGQLLWFANMMVATKGWRPGAEYHMFKEIYGTEPRPQDKCAPIYCIGGPVETWIALRPKQPKKRKGA